MCDEDDELLLRYHFGDLSAAEKTTFERRLESEPALAERLQKLCDCIAAHGVGNCVEEPKGDSEIPPKLADRTAHAILVGQFERAAECVGRKRFCLAEAIALGVAVSVLGMMVFPAIQASREASRRASCQFNLAGIYQGLKSFGEAHGNRLPEIGPYDNAGLFTVALADGGYLDREWLEGSLVCPSSELGSQLARGQLKVTVPTREALESALREQLAQWQRLMAGSYAYRIGYMDGDVYVSPILRGDGRGALMADAPTTGCGVAVVSRHHGECGENVLFDDGRVKFLTGCWAPDAMDHLYLNDASEVAAGRRQGDVVLAPSQVTPLGTKITSLGF